MDIKDFFDNKLISAPKTATIDEGKCEVCNKNNSIGVCSVPGVPFSCAYCKDCLKANAHPWHILVANTACMGGIDNANDFWKGMCRDTIKHLNKKQEEFDASVAESIKELKSKEKNRMRQKRK